MTIRVFLVDDQDLVRTGCAMVVDAQSDMTVVGEAGDGRQALDRLAVTRADVVLMDIRMPGLGGIEATEALLSRPGTAPRVIALTTFDLDEAAFAAIRAGASGFLLKDATADDLLAAIRTVHRGDAVLAPSTTRRLIEQIAPDLGTGTPTAAAQLTEREREVMFEVARGSSNAAIASTLFVSEGTVKTHVARILTKLGLRDRIQVVIWAYENRLIRPGR